MEDKKLIPALRFGEFEGEWKMKKIKEVAIIGRGKSKHRPRNSNHLFGGKYPFVQTGDIKNAYLYLTEFSQTYSEAGLKQSKLWSKNTLCITIAANIAETAILKIDACFPDSIIGLIPKENETAVLFVKYQFDKFKLDIQRLSQGVAQDNLNQEKLSNLEFNFPSLPEQQKIATFLTATDQRLQLLQQKKAKLKNYKKGVMQQLFSQELRFKDEGGGDFPDWEEKKLGEIGEFIGGGTPDSSNAKYWDGDIPWVSSSDIKDRLIHQIDITRFITKEALQKSATKITPKNSVLIVSRVGIGKFAVAKEDLCTSQDFTNLISSENPYFLAYYFQEKANIFIRFSQGTSIKGFTVKDIRNAKFLIPVLEEQKKIATFLTSLDQSIEKLSTQIDQTMTFKKGLLQKMFV